MRLACLNLHMLRNLYKLFVDSSLSRCPLDINYAVHLADFVNDLDHLIFAACAERDRNGRDSLFARFRMDGINVNPPLCKNAGNVYKQAGTVIAVDLHFAKVLYRFPAGSFCLPFRFD